MDFRLRKGRDIDLGAAPSSGPASLRRVSSVGLMARDFPGVTFDLRVSDGQMVQRGQEICIDRLNPDVSFVAAIAGRISRITYGPRRKIECIEISAEGTEQVLFDAEPAQTDEAALRSLLLKSGAWTAFRSRPFGRLPKPSDRPSAIFVTATDSPPLVAEVEAGQASQMESFQRGAQALLRLTDGPVFVCQRPGKNLVEPTDRLRVATFFGPHPSGLAGTHIHHIWPVSAQVSVWQIESQDVAAIGHLLATGQVQTERTVFVSGPGVAHPALITAPLGAKLRDLVPEAPTETAPSLMSGSVLTGRAAQFLARHDPKVTVLNRGRSSPPAQSFADRVLAKIPSSWTGATLPLEAFERAFPFDILPVPLMRALAVGDVETAERLGCLELLEDDMALLSWICPSGCDYGALLRSALDILAQERPT